MKTIKLASGFAVSALALAIAGQATAQTQSSVSFTGDVKVQTIIDFQNSQYTNRQPGLVAGHEDWYNFLASWSIVHGPFSGRLRIGINEDELAGSSARAGSRDSVGIPVDDDGEFVAEEGEGIVLVSGDNRSSAQVIVDSLIVEEGPVMFGQVGRVTATADLYESLTDINEGFGDEDTSTRFGVDLGARYTVSEAGLRLQLEAPISNDTFGVAGAITQNLDVAQVWLDGQYRVETADDGMDNDGTYNAGAAVQANLADPVVATGVFRTVSATAGASPKTVLAAQLEIAATEEVSVRGLITDRNFSSNAGTTVARVGATVSLAPFIIMADYEAATSSLTDAFYDARVTWADGPLTAFARVRYAQNDFDGAATNAGRLTTGVNFTTASGIKYGAEHNLTEKGYKAATQGSANELELFASYSF